jgi:membrane-associated phospholipid phosphatase
VPTAPAPEPGATRSLRARLVAGPVARRVAHVDLRIYRFVRRDLQVPAAQRAVTAYTTTGEHAALWYAVGVAGMLADRRHAHVWRRAMAGVFLTQLTNTAVKTVFRRSRPAFDELPALVKVPTSLSFPSAHSSSSFAAARGYSRLLPGRSGRALYGAAALMALSRVYLGVHYPSDIAVGAGLGLTIGSAMR